MFLQTLDQKRPWSYTGCAGDSRNCNISTVFISFSLVLYCHTFLSELSHWISVHCFVLQVQIKSWKNCCTTVRWCASLHCCSRLYRRTWERHLFLETPAMRLLALLSHDYLRTVDILKHLSSSGALLDIRNAEEGGNFFVPLFSAGCWACYFWCPVSHVNFKRSPPKAPIIISLSYKLMHKHVVPFFFEWQQSLVTVIAAYGFLLNYKKSFICLII